MVLGELIRRAVRRRVEARQVREHYRSLLRSTERIGVSGPARFSLSIDRMYIPIDLRDGNLDEVALDVRSGSVLLVGDPGIGKTTFLQMQARRAAIRGVRPGWELSGRFVALLNLAEFVGNLVLAEVHPGAVLETIASHITRQDQRTSEASAATLLRRMATGSGLVLLMDGLDEVAPAARPTAAFFISAIDRVLREAGPTNLLVVAGRPQALNLYGADLKKDFDTVARVGGLSASGIYAFALRWPYQSGDPERRANRVMSLLQSNDALLDACRNPLTLALFMQLTERSESNSGLAISLTDPFPETRTRLFEDMARYLTRSTRNPGMPASPSPLAGLNRMRMTILQQIAWSHLLGDRELNSIPDSDINAICSAQATEWELSESQVRQSIESTEVLVQEGDENWHFLHRSFLDFFAGLQIAGLRSNREIQRLLWRRRTDESRFDGAIIFACGISSGRSTSEPPLLAALKEQSRRLYIAGCRESQTFNSSFVEVMSSEMTLLDPRRDPDYLVEIFGALKDYTRVCRSLGRTPQISARSLLSRLERTLGGAGQAAELLARIDVGLYVLATEDSEPSVRSIELLIRSCEEPAGLTQAIAGALDDSTDGRTPWAAVVVEAALRSEAVASRLVELRTIARSTHVDKEWSRCWAVRGTLYGSVLDLAKAQFTSMNSSDFPHLALLASIHRPPRVRQLDVLRTAVAWPSSLILRSLLLVLAVACTARAGSQLSSGSVALGAAFALQAFALVMIAFLCGRVWPVLVSPASLGILNLAASRPDVHRRTIIRHRPLAVRESPSIHFGRLRPETGVDGLSVAYEAIAPFVWRRYSPPLGQVRLLPTSAAQLRQLSALDLAPIFSAHKPRDSTHAPT